VLKRIHGTPLPPIAYFTGRILMAIVISILLVVLILSVGAVAYGVEIQPDMRITYAGRSYSLCSESERWRADAMIGDAIARLSGLNLLVLDRFDVLDQPGRSAAMAWLLEVSHELETVIVGATLKQAPAIEGANVIWLSDELCGRSAVRTAA